jgi:serine/threonine-protein kinase RsbW
MRWQAAMSLPTRDGAEMHLRLPGILAARPMAMDFIASVCHSLHVPVDVEHAMLSAVGEAFNNVVVHSYRDVAGEVEIEVETGGERIVVRLRDRGAGFDPQKVKSRDLDELPEGGLGMFIMMRTMDDVRWYRQGEHNVVSMMKRIVK